MQLELLDCYPVTTPRARGRDFGTEHRSKGPSARLTTEKPVCHYARDGRREHSRLDLLRCHEKNLHESKFGRPFLMAVASAVRLQDQPLDKSLPRPDLFVNLS